ncbi:hypothetical protein NKDENANG_01636 [Candidatus Entotheonellaceae bacterium PAL068K]
MATPEAGWGRGLWLHSKGWDLCFLTLSGVFVVIPLALYEWVGNSAMFVNLFVAGTIGGPHMYATFFRTTLDRPFRQHHRFLVGSSFLVPLGVVGLAVWHFQLLITLFFFWASIHVLHQITYIMECYERKQHGTLQQWSRLIDYAVIFTCLFPMATYKFIHNEFYIGTTLLLYPEVLRTPLVFYAISGLFLVALALFIAKTGLEIRQGTAHYPKILLIIVTIGLSLFITSYNGLQLEIAFQGFNTWHSFQYLALTWYINTLRQQRGEIASPVMRWLSEARKGRFLYFYGINAALTLGALSLIVVVVALSGLPFERCYYIVVLSFLLMHYYHDHFLFTQFGDLVRP